jgi:type I restriction enzyme S subunit
MKKKQEAPAELLGSYELPAGWRLLKVRDVGDIKLGRQRSPEHHQGDHMRPYLRVANVYEDRIDTSDVLEMNFTPDEFETYRLEPGDILLNEGQSLEWVGRPAMYKGEVPGSCFQNTLVRFRAGPDLLPACALLVFRYYLHAGVFQRISKWTVNIAHLGAGRFAELDFPLPPREEQRRIVAAVEANLTRLDAGVANLDRVRAKLKRYRAAVLKAACEGRLVPTEAELARAQGRPYESADLLLARLTPTVTAEDGSVNSPTGSMQSGSRRGRKTSATEPSSPEFDGARPLPEGWARIRVCQAGEVKLGRQRSPEHHQGTHMRPYLRVANVYEDSIDTSDVLEMNFTPDEFETYRLEPGDILLNEGQSLEWVGRPAIFRNEVPGACFQNTLVRFRASPAVLPEYALTVFRSYLHSHRFRQIAKWTVNIAHLGAQRFANLEFSVPPLDEQTRIVAEVERRLSLIEELETAVAANLKRTDRLRQSILKRAFEGKLVPQGPSCGPATDLPYRIREESSSTQATFWEE